MKELQSFPPLKVLDHLKYVITTCVPDSGTEKEEEEEYYKEK